MVLFFKLGIHAGKGFIQRDKFAARLLHLFSHRREYSAGGRSFRCPSSCFCVNTEPHTLPGRSSTLRAGSRGLPDVELPVLTHTPALQQTTRHPRSFRRMKRETPRIPPSASVCELVANREVWGVAER